MLIDWFTVCAQALNFLILVWLLHRYLYKPVLAAIDAREKTVATKLADAAAQETKARAAGEELRKRNEAFDHERGGLLQKATADGAAERQRLIESARQDAQQLRVQLAQSLAAERVELGRQLAVRTQAEVFALTRKALSDLAGASLEERMSESAIERLRQLSQVQRQALAGVTGIVVRSAYDPPAAGRTRLEAAIHECLNPGIAVHYETAPEVVCGLELAADGVKLAWSVTDYLATLAQDSAALVAPELAHAP